MANEVLKERVGNVLLVTINRPEARNAIDRAVALGIADAIDQLDGDTTLRAGVLAGAGGTFSAGMDLKAFLRGESMVVDGRGMLGIVEGPPRKPLVAAVEGWALAGGFEIVLSCDLIVASETARFGLPEVQRSLVAMGGGAVKLPGRVGASVAMEMLLTGDPIDARRAFEVGLVNRVVPTGEASTAALALARRIAANGPLAVAASKAIATGAPDWTTSQAWQEQQRLGAWVFDTDDAREGATAFAEKREPVWAGR